MHKPRPRTTLAFLITTSGMALWCWSLITYMAFTGVDFTEPTDTGGYREVSP